MLMTHFDKKNIGNARCYASGWKGVRAPTAGEAAKVIAASTWSPCLWAHGVRKKANFRAATWLALDFDEGLSLEEAKIVFAPFLHIIGTTKNHGKMKNGVLADRFRVVLRSSEIITDRLVYEQTMRALCTLYRCDPAAKDAARLFWPCKDIVEVKYFGKTFKPVDVTEVKQARKAWSEYNKSFDKNNLPPWVLNYLRNGIPTGERNSITYRIGRELRGLGMTHLEAESLILASNIPSSGFTRKEITATVNSSFR